MSTGDVRILTTCVLLHSSVGLLQGVRGGGALRCRGAKEAEVSGAHPEQPLPAMPHDDAVAAQLFPATVVSVATLPGGWGTQAAARGGRVGRMGGSLRRLGRAGKGMPEEALTTRGLMERSPSDPVLEKG